MPQYKGFPRIVKTQEFPVRVLDTTYQNNEGHAILVYGSITLTTNAAGESAQFDCKSDASSPPTTVLCGGRAEVTRLHIERSSFCFIVLPGKFYRIDGTIGGIGPTVVLNQWVESDI